jgi:peroxiredoxin
MLIHDAEYVLQSRRAQGISPREPLSAMPLLHYGTELQRLNSRPWPRNLFGEHATIAELLAPKAAWGEEHPDDLCACGCGKEHRQRVSRIQPNPRGDGFDLVHFRSIACMNRWTWIKGQSQHDGRNQATSMSMEDSCQSSVLAPGTRAPEFTLHVTPDQALSLCDLAGKPTIIAFYPADWSPVCGDQMVLYNQVRPEFQRYGAELIGISVDGAWCHQAFAKYQNIHFPLLSDFEPKGAVARAYGAYRESDGVCERALFVIDKNGLVFWSYCAPIAVNPGADGILDALQRMMQQGG